MGRKQTLETRKKLRDKALGRKLSIATREAISKSLLDNPYIRTSKMRERASETSKKWHREHPDHCLKILQQWRKENPAAYAGANNPAWKGGRIKNMAGYVFIYCPGHPCNTRSNHVREHRLIMEKHLGRYLTKQETVHHENEIVDDNRIENLVLFPTRRLHIKHHRALERIKNGGQVKI